MVGRKSDNFRAIGDKHHIETRQRGRRHHHGNLSQRAIEFRRVLRGEILWLHAKDERYHAHSVEIYAELAEGEELESTATFVTLGKVSLRSSNHFSLKVAPAVSEMPVTLPPGRARSSRQIPMPASRESSR